MIRSASVLLAVLGAGAALAQTASPVALTLALFTVKTVTVDGKTTEQLTPSPDRVLPGEVLSQVVTVRNTGTRSVTRLPVTLPVPKSTTYLAPEPGLDAVRAEYSTDGKTFAPAPLMKTVTVTENGRAVSRQVEVRPNEYTAVRWVLAELRAGQSVKLGYRVQVK